MPEIESVTTDTSAPSDPASILEAAMLDIPIVVEEEPEPNEDRAPEPSGTQEVPAPAASGAETPEEAATDIADDDLVVDAQRPWTPARAAKLHERQLARERELDAVFIRARKKEDKANKRLADARQELERSDLVNKQLSAALAGLRGSGKEVLEALGRLTGRTGAEVYEEMSLDIAGARKADPKDAMISRLEEKLDKLSKKLEDQEESKSQAATVAAVRADISRIVADSESWPTIAGLSEADPKAAAADFEEFYVAHCRQNGTWVDVEAFADRLERSLRKGAATKPSDSGNRAVSAKPGDTTHRASVKTLTPSLAAVSSGSRRELTEDERTEDLARDPDFLRDLGLM